MGQIKIKKHKNKEFFTYFILLLAPILQRFQGCRFGNIILYLNANPLVHSSFLSILGHFLDITLGSIQSRIDL